MTRIIQRCFLVLAFTGVLLSGAQETTSSDTSHSTTQSGETSSSAPESSSDPVGPPSSRSPVVKTENESSSYPSTTATGNPNADVTTGVLHDTSSGSTAGIASAIPDVSTSASKEPGISEDKVQKSTAQPDDSGGLHKAELHDGESQAAEIPSEENPESSDKSIDGESAKKESSGAKEQNVSDSSVSDSSNETITEDPDSASETSSVSETVVGERTTTTIVALQSSEANFSENATNDSGESSVPSKEETIYNSSYVDKNQSPAEMSSTSSSKVQTAENGTADISEKSATRKRSLNATNTASSSTSAAAVDSEQVSSSTPAVGVTDGDTSLPSETTEAKDIDGRNGGDVFVTMKQPFFVEASPNVQAMAVKDKFVTEAEVTESEVTDFPHTINSATPNADVSVAHFHESEHVARPMSSHEDVHLPPISSAALSTLTEDSIHPFESIGTTTAQAPNDSRRGGIPAASSGPQRSPELEIESAVPTGQLYPSPFTFDPDGLTHNFSQDPDSVTFSPDLFHVDGMPTDGYLSRLEHDESSTHKPELEREVFFTGGTTMVQESSSRKTEEGLYPFEREREFMPSSNPDALPHDEPDIEDIMYSRNFAPSTVHPPMMAENPSSTAGSLDIHTQDNGKIILPLNDESEEMLNDSPHFFHIQSKPTVVTTSTAEVKDEYVSKDLETTNFGNDITHHTIVSPGPQNNNTTETANELDPSTEYHQTEQSEIRPVTAASPFKPLDSTTLTTTITPPNSTESHGSANSDTVLPDTSSPITNLSNPTPIAASNQSVELITVTVLGSQPDDVTAQSGNASDAGREDELTTVNSTSTIAGVAVRTSVSVSIPLSSISNDTLYSANSTVIQDGNETNTLSNGSEIILPLPIPINKDADGHPAPSVASPTEAPTPSTTESRIPRIRKPKLKINSDDSDSTPAPRTRKPFITSLQKPSTTVGPPVSIFKKPRTRLQSITSSTTARPFPQFSTIRVHYASRLPPGMVPGGELVISTEPITTTVPTTTETEEPFSDEPFTEQTQGPIISSEDDVTLIRVAGFIVVEKGLRWNNQLDNRHSPQYKEKANFVTMQLYRLFRTSPIATRLWQVKIDGFSVKKPRSVAIDFFLLLIKTPNEITMDQLITVFHDKLKNNTFSRFTVDTNKTSFELLDYESIKPTTEPPEEEPEPVIPQWAIAVIVVGAASLIFIVLFAAVAILGRHHVRRRYSSKLNDEDSDRPSDWESKMAAAYENLAADTIYDAEDLPSDSYKKRHHNSTCHGRPTRPRRADSWSSSDWSPPPRRPRPQVHRIVY